MKKGKIAWYGTLALIAVFLVFDLWLNSNDEQMTISQMVYDAGQQHPYIIVIAGVGFVFLFVHLFIRWKHIFRR